MPDSPRRGGERHGMGFGSGLSRKARDGSEALRGMDPPPKKVDVLVFGHTGFDESPEAAFAEGLRSAVRSERVILTSDAVSSYLGDDGGGYYTGRRGLASALRTHEFCTASRDGERSSRRRSSGRSPSASRASPRT